MSFWDWVGVSLVVLCVLAALFMSYVVLRLNHIEKERKRKQ